MRKKINKEKHIEALIRLTYDSLQSHLKYTHISTSEGKDFHKKCVKDYALMINLLSDLL